MIKTKKEYEDTLLTIYQWIGSDYQKNTRETIEALREVARAAKHHAARGYANSQPDWRFVVLDKLEALPDWIIEEEK